MVRGISIGFDTDVSTLSRIERDLFVVIPNYPNICRWVRWSYWLWFRPRATLCLRSSFASLCIRATNLLKGGAGNSEHACYLLTHFLFRRVVFFLEALL